MRMHLVLFCLRWFGCGMFLTLTMALLYLGALWARPSRFSISGVGLRRLTSDDLCGWLPCTFLNATRYALVLGRFALLLGGVSLALWLRNCTNGVCMCVIIKRCNALCSFSISLFHVALHIAEQMYRSNTAEQCTPHIRSWFHQASTILVVINILEGTIVE